MRRPEHEGEFNGGPEVPVDKYTQSYALNIYMLMSIKVEPPGSSLPLPTFSSTARMACLSSYAHAVLLLLRIFLLNLFLPGFTLSHGLVAAVVADVTYMLIFTMSALW